MTARPTRNFILAAGGTGGHMIPAHALAHELMNRGHHVALITDERGSRIPGLFDRVPVHVLPAGRMSKNPIKAFKAFRAIMTGRAMAMRRTYIDLVTGDPGRAGYATLLRSFLDPAAGSVLYHCTAGKDRTGWGTSVLLLALGVDEADVRDEYLAVNPALDAMYAPFLQRFADVGGDPGLLAPLLEVREEYLDAALGAVAEGFGGFGGYLRDGLGLTADEVAALRAVLLD